MAEIRLQGVTKRYGSFTALDDLSLTIEDGSFTSIFGAPGAGKSVLLRVLLGLEPVDAGRILIGGRDVTGASPNARGLSMVFQNLALFPHLTARENIVFPLRRRRTPEDEIARRLDSVVGVLGVAHVLHKRPAALSGGERQRVAIGRALIRDAGAYMMDEPIAALDARLRDATRVELKRLQAELGRTFIYVTHDSEEAMSVADRLAIIEKGRIVQVAAPDDVYARPTSLSVAQLVGSPRINVLRGRRGALGIDSAFGLLPFPPGEGDVDIGLRPESLRLTAPGAATLRGAVSDVERLGGFAVVTVDEAGAQLRTVADGAVAARIGDIVGLAPDPEGMHVFSAATGDRIAERAA